MKRIFDRLRLLLTRWRHPEIIHEFHKFDEINRSFFEAKKRFLQIYKASDSYNCGDWRCCPVLWWQKPDGFYPGHRINYHGTTMIYSGPLAYQVKIAYGYHYKESSDIGFWSVKGNTESFLIRTRNGTTKK